MDFKVYNPNLILEIPASQMNIPVSNDYLFNQYSLDPILETNVDICQQGVKNQNDFSRQIVTSGGLMYEKSRVLF